MKIKVINRVEDQVKKNKNPDKYHNLKMMKELHKIITKIKLFHKKK